MPKSKKSLKPVKKKGVESLSLSKLQRQFKKALKEPKAKNLTFGNLIKVTPTFTKAQRLDVYQYAYGARIEESFIEDFSLLHEFMGEKKFKTLMGDYLKKHPSSSWTLGELGEHLGAFLGKSPLYRKQKHLAELAKLDWLKIEAYMQAEPAYFDFSTLAQMEEETLQKLKLILNPTLRTLKSSFDVEDLSRLKQDLKTSKKSVKRNYHFAILRHQGDIHVRSVMTEDWAILQKMKKTITFGDLTALLSKRDPQSLTRLFSLWVQQGIIADLQKS